MSWVYLLSSQQLPQDMMEIDLTLKYIHQHVHNKRQNPDACSNGNNVSATLTRCGSHLIN